MNCLEFRRRLLIDPCTREEAGAFQDHVASCPGCAREAEKALQFERRLHAALDVPHRIGLESRILSAQPARGDLVFGFQWLSMAAGIFLSVGVAGWLGYHWEDSFSSPSGLELTVVNHIIDEVGHLHEDHDIGFGELVDLLAPLGAELKASIGRVNYASRCNIRQHPGVHLVVAGLQGPVTVLMMPGEFLNTREDVRTTRFTGVIVPTRYGSMAVVGEKNETLEPLVKRIQQAVVWDV